VASLGTSRPRRAVGDDHRWRTTTIRQGATSRPEVDLEAVDRHAPRQEAAELDSMDFLNLIAALHDETGIEVPESDSPAVA
jgi:acyl carrier protein